MSEELFYETDLNVSIGISLKELMEYYHDLCEQ